MIKKASIDPIFATNTYEMKNTNKKQIDAIAKRTM